MANTKFSALAEQAEAAGVGFYEPAPGTYDLIIKNANVGATKAGDPKVGLQVTMDGGPDAGKSFWTNFNFKSTNAVGVAISFRQLAELGFPKEQMLALPENNEAASDAIAAALIGTKFTAEVQINGDDRKFINLNKIKRTGAGEGQPSTAAPASNPAPDAKPF